jgi:chemotaxis protein MotB
MSEERAKPQEEFKKGAPLWVVTFTDMSSLLLTFFILILTFSSTESEQLSKAEGSLQGSFGMVTNRRRARPHATESLSARNIKRDRRGPTNESLRADQVAEAFNQTQRRDLFKTKIDNVAEGFRLEIEPYNGEEHFALYTGKIHPNTKKLLKEAGTLLRSLPCRVVVRTHVDSRTWKVRQDTSALKWTLDHALTAAEVLEETGLAPERISVSPRADLDPVATDADDELSRYRNRRLEILVIPDDKDPLYDMGEKGGA